MTVLSDVVNAFEGNQTIAKERAATWLSDPDVQVAGAAYAYLEKAHHMARVTPPLDKLEFAQLSLEYLKRCLLDVQAGEWAHSQFEAAWALVPWLADRARQPSKSAVDFVQWLGDAYKAHPELHQLIVTGLLEHVIGSPHVDRLFDAWRLDPELTQALVVAWEWKGQGGKSPIDSDSQAW